VVCWPIKHISIYFLTVHENTQFYYKLKSKEIVLPDQDNLVDLYKWSVGFFAENGFEQYEISNFAKFGYESKHNETYWERKSYKGFGVSACSFDGATRFQNHCSLLTYLEGIEQGNNIEILEEKLTEGQIRLEKLMLGLRRSKGVKLSELFENISESKKLEIKQKLEFLKTKKFICQQGEDLFLTLSGLVVEDEIVTMLAA
jgi:oxygen-independent coproporphyrinogen-3 oxidase